MQGPLQSDGEDSGLGGSWVAVGKAVLSVAGKQQPLTTWGPSCSGVRWPQQGSCRDVLRIFDLVWFFSSVGNLSQYCVCPNWL